MGKEVLSTLLSCLYIYITCSVICTFGHVEHKPPLSLAWKLLACSLEPQQGQMSASKHLSRVLHHRYMCRCYELYTTFCSGLFPDVERDCCMLVVAELRGCFSFMPVCRARKLVSVTWEVTETRHSKSLCRRSLYCILDLSLAVGIPSFLAL